MIHNNRDAFVETVKAKIGSSDDEERQRMVGESADMEKRLAELEKTLLFYFLSKLIILLRFWRLKVNISAEMFIKEARYFQTNGQYDLALNELEKAQSYDITNKYYVEIQKLICYNYRKMGDFKLALLHINYAINYLQKSNMGDEKEKDYAICLMNKGVVFEEQGEVYKAEEYYLLALKIFKEICLNMPNDYGLLINAYFTIGALYFQQKKYDDAANYLRSALPFFLENKENDRRYISIIKTLSEIENLKGN